MERALRNGIRGFLIAGGVLVASAGAAADAGKHIAVAAVFSQVAKDYQRQKLPDGSIQPEYYVMSMGGQVKGTTTDETVDHVTSRDFVELLRHHLAAQNYLLAPDIESADLVLRVNWGRTVPFSGDANFSTATDEVAQSLTNMSAFGGIGDDGYVSPEERADADAAATALENAMIMIMAENRRRDQANQFNAGLLGYREEMSRWIGSPASLSAAGILLDDLRGDVEGARYYLLVFAYERRAIADQKEPRLRWVTRISIRAPGNRFDQNLARMIERAGRYFGRDSGGLVRRFEGTVELGEPEVIGVVEDDPALAPAAPDSSRQQPDGATR